MSGQTPISIEGALRVPGLLLQPFRWAAEPLMRLALAEPRLLAHPTDLTALRLHVITFYLAVHDDDYDDSATAGFLASARSRNILERALARPPQRLLGLLRRLPDQAMSIATYKQLAAPRPKPEQDRGHCMACECDYGPHAQAGVPACSVGPGWSR